ncbi:general stress protein [Evansella sp. LMS18]|uniref:general stress protein n=1 Tax=Evansella sp. LMS18 TaxID=2924033 RepID=UPI0020D045C4|nr:general stress protein [Evansella sp. LMS18]UTR09932.1 general stress protein [Evansella sp. LMS18]
MAYSVTGVFSSEQEVREEVEKLRSRGYQPNEIYLVSGDHKENSWLRQEATVEDDTTRDTDTGEGSFWGKVKDFFKDNESNSDNSRGYEDRLKNLGLTDSAAKEYGQAAESGKIVVLVPEEGNATGEGNITEGKSAAALTDEDLSKESASTTVGSQPPHSKESNPIGGSLQPERDQVAAERDDSKENEERKREERLRSKDKDDQRRKDEDISNPFFYKDEDRKI